MKKIQIFTLLLLTVIISAILYSCAPGACKHKNTEVIPGKEATCTQFGKTEGLRCLDCDEVIKEQEEIPPMGHRDIVTDPAVEPTCTKAGSTEGTHCGVCGETLSGKERIEPLGHTTDTGVCTRCGENFGKWIISNYVDEFNEPTDVEYVTNLRILEGVFSNSATTNSELGAYFLIDKQFLAICLYEYGDFPVKNSYGDENIEYSITMKTPDNEKASIDGIMPPGADRIFITSPDDQTVLESLSSTGTVGFYIVETEYPTTTYSFSVETSNFAEMYSSLG